jgi:hypothetical protein
MMGSRVLGAGRTEGFFSFDAVRRKLVMCVGLLFQLPD